MIFLLIFVLALLYYMYIYVLGSGYVSNGLHVCHWYKSECVCNHLTLLQSPSQWQELQVRRSYILTIPLSSHVRNSWGQPGVVATWRTGRNEGGSEKRCRVFYSMYVHVRCTCINNACMCRMTPTIDTHCKSGYIVTRTSQAHPQKSFSREFVFFWAIIVRLRWPWMWLVWVIACVPSNSIVTTYYWVSEVSPV